MHTDLYTQTKSQLPDNDKGFCVPIAISLSTGMDVNEVNDKLCQTPSIQRPGKMMRSFRTGVYPVDWKAFLKSNDFDLTPVPVRAKTVASLDGELDPSKRYIVHVRRHVLAVVNGRVQDWTSGRRHRIKEVFEITRLDDEPFEPVPETEPVKPEPVPVPDRPVPGTVGIKALRDALFVRVTALAEGKAGKATVSGRWLAVKMPNRRVVKIAVSRGVGYIVCIAHSNKAMHDAAAERFRVYKTRKLDTTFIVDDAETITDFVVYQSI